MIRAEELLGEVRAPQWRGKPPRVFTTAQVEIFKGIEEAVAKRKAVAAEKRRIRALELPALAEIGAAIRAARTAKGHPIKVCAWHIGTTASSLDDYERGLRPLPERYWPKVLEVYGVDVAARLEAWRAAR